MPATTAALHGALDAGRSGRDVLDAVEPALKRAEAEGDQAAEDDLRGVVARAWGADLHPHDRPELVAIRELFRTEPGWRVACAAEAALARHLAREPDFAEPRQAAFLQLAFSARLTGRLESWGGAPLKRGRLDGDPGLDWL